MYSNVSLVSRPFHRPVFDRLQYAKTAIAWSKTGWWKGLGTRLQQYNYLIIVRTGKQFKLTFSGLPRLAPLSSLSMRLSVYFALSATGCELVCEIVGVLCTFYNRL